MPYERNSDLPTTVRDVLPVEAQTMFRTIVNNALEQYDDEGKAFATAWAGLRRAGWERDDDGRWRKVGKKQEPAFAIGDNVTPTVSHIPGQKGKPAEVAIVRNGPYYALDFGDGEPHKWYAEDELGTVDDEPDDSDDDEMAMARKRGGDADYHWERQINIAKQDDDQRLVFGWLSVAVDAEGKSVVDSQNDIIPPDELEKAAYDFVLYARRAGEMHERTDGIGRLVESMVFTKEKAEALGIPDGILPHVAWWIGFRIDDADVWAKVKSGTYRAFSVGGKAKRERQGGEM